MRDFIFPAVLFAVLAAICVFYAGSTERFIGRLSEYTGELEAAGFSPENGGGEIISEMDGYFSARKGAFSVLMNHDVLDEIEMGIQRLKVLQQSGDGTLFYLELRDLKTVIDDIQNEQRASPENILKNKPLKVNI